MGNYNPPYEITDKIVTVSYTHLQRFLQAAEMLQESAGEIVPVEISIGGPLTIASFLREIELLLRDCRRNGDKVQKLLRIIVDSQKSCIDAFAQYGAVSYTHLRNLGEMMRVLLLWV